MIGTAADPVPAFRAAMAARGLATPDPITPDGTLHRVHIEGDRRGTRNGWCVLYGDDPAAGAFGCWKRGISANWCARSEAEMDASELREFRRRMDEAKAAREAERRQLRERAAHRARRLWNEAEPADAAHPYLRSKQVQPHGIRQSGPRLIVPLRSTDGTLHGLQYIGPDGTKRFLPGTAKRGRYHPIGTPNGVLVVAEGYATAATIHEATGHAAAVAFDAGNLRPVAEALRAKFPGAHIILAADNDRQTDGNPGRSAALDAARAAGGRVAVPDFAHDEPGTDWNDMMTLHGPERVAAGIEAATAPKNNEPGSPEADPPRLSLRTLADILRDPDAMKPPEPVVPRLAWAGRVTLLAGREKLGKSTLASAGGAATSDHARFLGEMGTPGPVLWVGLEEHPGDTAQRFQTFGANPDRVYLLDRLERPYADLAAAVERTGAVLVVVDTLARFAETLVDDPGSSAKWTPVMGGLTRLARNTGAAVLLLHHARKSDGKYRDSTAIGAGVDAVLEMHPGDEASIRKLHGKARWAIEDCAVRLHGDRYTLAAGELSMDARVLLFVDNNPGCSMRKLSAGVSGKAETVLVTARRLLSSGAIEDRGDATASRLYPVSREAENRPLGNAPVSLESVGETRGETVPGNTPFPDSKPKDTQWETPPPDALFADLADAPVTEDEAA